MVKKQNKLVEGVISLEKGMNELTSDKIEEQAPKVSEAEEISAIQLTQKQIASDEGVRWIEPLHKARAFGTLPPQLKKKHARDWEYVKGIYENNLSPGEGIKFSLSLYPGDPDCTWYIPCGVPVYVPRMVATHLEDVQKFHKFSYIENDVSRWCPDSFMDTFSPTETHYRGKFRPIGAFA